MTNHETDGTLPSGHPGRSDGAQGAFGLDSARITASSPEDWVRHFQSQRNKMRQERDEARRECDSALAERDALATQGADVEVRVEWGVRFDWTGSNVQQWGRTWSDEFEARLSLDQYLNDPEVTAAWLVTRTVTVSPWTPAPQETT